jgi:hypothetical protein
MSLMSFEKDTKDTKGTKEILVPTRGAWERDTQRGSSGTPRGETRDGTSDHEKTDRLAVPPLPWPARAGQLLVRSLPETNAWWKSKRRANWLVVHATNRLLVVTISG